MLFASTNFTIEDDPFYMAGMRKGIAEGIAEGKAEGIAKVKKEMALVMKKRGTDLTFIAEVTQLTIEEIETL